MALGRAALLGLALVLLLPAAASAAPFRTCTLEGLTGFDCTRVSVPLDRSGKVAGRVRLLVARTSRGTAGAAAKEPIFAFAGGPGQGASSVAGGFRTDFFGQLGTRDLVVFDQRGTGFSGALNCRGLERRREQAYRDAVADCAEELGSRRAFYTTRDTVEDIEAVRRRIGKDKITLFGVSYGTKVVSAYALKYPQHVQRMILDSVVEPEGQNVFDLDTFAATPRVLREVCRGECEGVTDDLPGDLARLIDQMNGQPLSGPFVGPDGRTKTVDITARLIYSQIREGDLTPFVRAIYPGAIHSAASGDPAPLLRLEHRFDFAREPEPEPEPEPGPGDEGVRFLSSTLQTATICEEAPLPWERTASPDERLAQARAAADAIPDSAFEPFDRATAFAFDNNSVIEQCIRWPTSPVEPVLASGPLPDVPVLVFEGEEDLRTPVEVGARMAARFPQARLVRVPKSGHSVLGRGAKCANIVLRRFFAGEPLRRPCLGAEQTVKVRPLDPASLADVAPAPGTSGVRGRTLAAVVRTLEDFERESQFLSTGEANARGGGLRGGRFFTRAGIDRLDRFSYVPGVEVSGPVGRSEARAGTLTISGAAASAGALKLRRGGLLTGRLGGKRVSTRVPPPVLPFPP